jgi:hypothetical protein
MDQEKEIHWLSAENLAIQAVLVHVLRHLAKSDPNLWMAVAAGFDDAASEVENTAMQHGAEAKSDRTLEALRMATARSFLKVRATRNVSRQIRSESVFLSLAQIAVHHSDHL